MGEEKNCHTCACEVNEWYRKYLLYEIQLILDNASGLTAAEVLPQIMQKLEEAKVYNNEENSEHECPASTIVLHETWVFPSE